MRPSVTRIATATRSSPPSRKEPGDEWFDEGCSVWSTGEGAESSVELCMSYGVPSPVFSYCYMMTQ